MRDCNNCGFNKIPNPMPRNVIYVPGECCSLYPDRCINYSDEYLNALYITNKIAEA